VQSVVIGLRMRNIQNSMVLLRAIPPWGGQPDRNPFSRWENSSVSNCKASIYHSRINSTERKGNSTCKLAWVHLKAYYKPYECFQSSSPHSIIHALTGLQAPPSAFKHAFKELNMCFTKCKAACVYLRFGSKLATFGHTPIQWYKRWAQ